MSLATEELPDKVRKLLCTRMSSPPKDWQCARAWMQDATYLQTLLREHRQALGKQQNHPIQQLAQAAAKWEEAIDDFLKHQAAKRGTGESRQAVPPHMRIKWCSQEHSTPQTRHRVCLRLATFGWWRSSSQRQTNYMKLANHLGHENVHVCTVTGQPVSSLLNHIRGTGRYTWFGPIVDNHQGVGLLTHTSLCHMARQLATPNGVGTRMVVPKIG